jgi:putative transposase
VRPKGEFGIARKRHSDEDCLKILRQVELDLAGGADVAKAGQSAGISDVTYHRRAHRFSNPGLDECRVLWVNAN